MMVYRAATRAVQSGGQSCWLPSSLDTHDARRRFLIHFGEIEAALVDAGHDEAPLRETSLWAARALLNNAAANDRPPLPPLPESIEISVPEGYAYYGLFPETYAISARRFFAEDHPRNVVVLGIRSIGTSLSAVVAAALEQCGCNVHRRTVRPTGHPFDRRLALDEALHECATEAHFAIVDEGPGLSGSSFTAVAEAVSALGVPDQRIVLFPSHRPNPARFVSERARARWPRHRKFQVASPAPPPGATFAGLGGYGDAKHERALALAAAGFSPAVQSYRDGFLTLEQTPDAPARVSTELLDFIARYCAFRAREFATDAFTPPSELGRMTHFNSGVSVGFAAPERPCICDAALQAENWRTTARGFLKLDTLDHGDGHFYPGPTDIAWDLAGVITELHLESQACEYLLWRYLRESGDYSIARRLDAYRAAYHAFRLGCARMFPEQLRKAVTV